MPGDWHVVMCDVRDSTAAIESGRYKNVNTLGAAFITAMLNAAGETQIPFVFEGDGAMLCVPPELLDPARAALLQTQELARRSFALDLRIATMTVARVREAGMISGYAAIAFRTTTSRRCSPAVEWPMRNIA